MRKVLSRLSVFVLLAAFIACRSKRGEHQGDRGKVLECEAYAARLGACVGRDQPAAHYAEAQAASLAFADNAQRARMRATCARDLTRIKSSCH